MEKRLSEANDLRESEHFSESLKSYTDCLIDLVNTKDFTGLIHCLGGQSLIYKNLLTRNNSPVYHHFVMSLAEETLEVAEANKDSLDARTLSIAYSIYGDAMIDSGEISEALSYFEKSFAVSTAGLPEKGRLKAHMGMLKYMLGDKKDGISTVESALKDIRTGEMDTYAVRVWETGALNGLAKIYAKEGDKAKALEIADESLNIATSHNLSIRKREVEIIIDKINSGDSNFIL